MGKDGNIGLDATKRPVRVPPEFAYYLENHDVFRLFEGLMQNLLIDTPEDPLDWMIQFLKGPEVPRIFVGGPPAVGKRTVCDVAAKSCGATVVDVATVVAAAVTADASLGEAKEVSTEKVTSLLVARLNEDDCKTHGYILRGYPQTRPQALALQMAGILPTLYILLDADDGTVRERSQGRLDGADGEVYHSHYKAVPEGLKVTTRDSDQNAVFEENLRQYRRNVHDMEMSFKTIMRKIDADQMFDDVHANVWTAVCTKPYSNAPTVPRILLVGPPGSGKRTQAEMLSIKYNLVHVSMADLKKQAMSGSRSKAASAYRNSMETGALVPDKVLFALISDRLRMLDCATQGWALEGFPMTASQAKMLESNKFVPSRTFFLEVPAESANERISSRRVDPVTGDRFNVGVGADYNPAGSEDARARLRIHPNDGYEHVQKVVAEFAEHAESIRAEYPGATNINADQDYLTVFQCIDGRLVMPILPKPAAS